MKKYLLVFYSLCFLLTACSDPMELAENDYLIFGGYAGECAGNCTNFYKIADEKLYQDNLDWGTPDEIPFLSSPLSNDKYLIAEPLINEFPEVLINEETNMFGCPDCGDQGGILVELKRDGVIHRWQMDVIDFDDNEEVLSYSKKIIQIVNELK